MLFHVKCSFSFQRFYNQAEMKFPRNAKRKENPSASLQTFSSGYVVIYVDKLKHLPMFKLIETLLHTGRWYRYCAVKPVMIQTKAHDTLLVIPLLSSRTRKCTEIHAC